MKTEGIEGWLLETHNWGKTVAFWKGLGYELEFETDHHSGRNSRHLPAPRWCTRSRSSIGPRCRCSCATPTDAKSA